MPHSPAWTEHRLKHILLCPAAAPASLDGFLLPGQDVKLEVVFQPVAVESDIRVERAKCRWVCMWPFHGVGM